MAAEIFMLCFCRTRLNDDYIADVPFTKSARAFVCCAKFYFFFKNI